MIDLGGGHYLDLYFGVAVTLFLCAVLVPPFVLWRTLRRPR